MSALWTSTDAVAATGGHSDRAWTASGVSIDTRTIAPGDLFVALTDQRDGHDFVAQALRKGASAAMVRFRPEGVAEDAPLLIVEDVLEGLGALAVVARARAQAKVIAVTGSVGKTSTKDMLRTALGGQGRVHAAEKSYNNHWGVPLTLARMPAETDYAIIEIGMNAPGEIAPLSRLARPHVAMITTIAAVHMAAFKNLKGIAIEKAAIFEGLEPGGVAVLNRDMEKYGTIARLAGKQTDKVLRFGWSGRPEFAMDRINLTEYATSAQAKIDGRFVMFKLAAPGKHLAMNALGVLAAVQAVGGDVGRAAVDLGTWTTPEGRGTRWDISLGPEGIDGTIHLIDESFNANPTAMAAALEVFAVSKPKDGIGRVSKGRRIAFLADMLELGAKEHQMHADLAKLDALKAVDLVHCAGPRMQALHDALPKAIRGEWHPDSATLAARVPRLLDAGDVAMAKGSKGARVTLVVDAIKKLGEPRPHIEAEGLS